MSKLIVKSGLVFDPLNNINGEVKDILIEDGKIVEKFSSTKNVNEIDAKNKTVIPAAIEIDRNKPPHFPQLIPNIKMMADNPIPTRQSSSRGY